MLIQIAAQLRRADEEFRNHAKHLLEVLSAQDGKPRLNNRHPAEPIESGRVQTDETVPILSLGKIY